MQDFNQRCATTMNENNMTPAKGVINCIQADAFRQHQVQITGARVHATQIPGKENEHTAVVEAELQTNRGAFGGIGAANPASLEGNTHVNVLLGRATAEALANASTLAMFAVQTQEKTLSVEPSSKTNTFTPQVTHIESVNHSQKYQKHSTTKAASEKQIGLVMKICAREGISEQEAREQAGIQTTSPMSSSDAHGIISHFKSKFDR